MSKKNFIALADAVREIEVVLQATALPVQQTAHVGVVVALVRTALADFCAAQNPQFNRGQWLRYVAGECGPNGGKL